MSMESGIRRYADVFAASFRDAINARGLTLARLHEQLRARGNSVSMATLSYWRSGARRPEGAQSMAALSDIEQLLHLEPGSLTALLGTTNRTGPLGPNQFPLDEQELEQAVKDAFAALGAEYPDTSRELTTHSVTDVDADGNVSYSITRSIVQSTVGTVSSIPFLEMTPGVSTPAPIISAVAGGRIAARYSHPNGEVHGVLFELDVPLTAPSTSMVEWSVEYPPGYPPQRETGHAVARQCRELLVWTRFHPDALPDRIEERAETPAGIKTTELSLEGRNSVHQVRRAFGPGLLGVSWSYADGR
ncbi:hypothetical protein JOF42_000424 [Microbacterium phyllosphaerae]|uniref:XRE family transcriptional regulator n=1 Tax=Microbacterium phyllosphaerae TaxID=124798 RepID=A0ABS4WN21_9MICO|nr:hypothetical protein [Microbacterium phyllosphaerae]MBP2376929.1 hypothetical protein [Microbacterium phyllosphaerae]